MKKFSNSWHSRIKAFEPTDGEAIDADTAARHYEHIYNLIKAARDRAGDTKRLVILVGEDHIDNLSLLHKLMIADAAKRLGIRHEVQETDTPQAYMDDRQRALPKDKQYYASSLQRAMKDDHIYAGMEQEALINGYPNSVGKDHEDMDISLMALKATELCRPIEGFHAVCAHQYMQMLGYDFTNGDPNNGKFWTRFGPRIENAMIASIRAEKEPCIAHYGQGHIPPLYHALKADPNIELLTIDTSNEITNAAKPGGLTRKRLGELQKIRPEIETLIIQGNQPTVQEATKIAIQASLAHRVTLNEMTEERGDMLSYMTEELYKHMLPKINKEVQRISEFRQSQMQ
jgi:hypothetical protein